MVIFTYKLNTRNEEMIRFLLCFLFLAGTLRSQKIICDSLHRIADKEDTVSLNIKGKLIFDLLSVGSYDSALKYSSALKVTSEKYQYTKGIIMSNNFLGMVARNKGNNKQALEYYTIALKLAEKSGNERFTSNVHHNMARVYDNQGNYTKALEHLFTSLRLKEKNHDKKGIANTLGHIGNIYYAQNDTKSMDYYFRSLKIQKEIRNYPGVTIALNEIGLVYLQKRDYQMALFYFLESLEVNKRVNYKPEIAHSLNYIGTIYRLQKFYTKALEYYIQALALQEELNNTEAQASALNDIGKLYYEQKEYKKAVLYFEKANLKATDSGVLRVQKDVFENLSSTYLALNNTANALIYYKQFIIIRDSIFNDENRKLTISKQLKYEYEKRALAYKMKTDEDKKLALAQVKQLKTQSYALSVSLVLLILVGVILFQRFQHNQKIKLYKLRDKIASDLHDDVGSALSSISMASGIARMNPGKEAIENAVKSIEDTSRETIENINDIVWSIQSRSDKLTHVIERMRSFGNRLFSGTPVQFLFLIEPQVYDLAIKMEQRRNVYLIFKEAINNAAKYANAGQVSVEIKQSGKGIKLVITDNGAGFIVEEADSGNGLYNMKQRAKELKGTLFISSKLLKGTKIELEFIPT